MGIIMPTLQVRNLPKNLYQTLKKQAKVNHRSLTQQAIVSLDAGLHIVNDNQKRRRVLLSKLVDLSSHNLPNPVALIREDRDR